METLESPSISIIEELSPSKTTEQLDPSKLAVLKKNTRRNSNNNNLRRAFSANTGTNETNNNDNNVITSRIIPNTSDGFRLHNTDDPFDLNDMNLSVSQSITLPLSNNITRENSRNVGMNLRRRQRLYSENYNSDYDSNDESLSRPLSIQSNNVSSLSCSMNSSFSPNISKHLNNDKDDSDSSIKLPDIVNRQVKSASTNQSPIINENNRYYLPVIDKNNHVLSSEGNENDIEILDRLNLLLIKTPSKLSESFSPRSQAREGYTRPPRSTSKSYPVHNHVDITDYNTDDSNGISGTSYINNEEFSNINKYHLERPGNKPIYKRIDRKIIEQNADNSNNTNTNAVTDNEIDSTINSPTSNSTEPIEKHNKTRKTSKSIVKEQTTNQSNNFEIPIVPTTVYIETKDLQPSTNPNHDFQKILSELEENDWEKLFSNLNLLRSIIINHSNTIIQSNKLSIIIRFIIKQINNLRSAVAKNAIITLGDLFQGFGKLIDSEINNIIPSVIKRFGDSSTFLVESVEESLKQMIEHISPIRSLNALLISLDNKNGNIRGKVMYFIYLLIYNKSNEINKSKDFEILCSKLNKLIVDSSPNTRLYCRKIILYILDHSVLNKSEFDSFITNQTLTKALKDKQLENEIAKENNKSLDKELKNEIDRLIDNKNGNKKSHNHNKPWKANNNNES